MFILIINSHHNYIQTFTLYDHSLSSYLTIIFIHFFFLFEDTNLYNWFNTGVYM